MKPLTYPMKLALRDIAANEQPPNVNGGWVNSDALDLDRRTIRALKGRGLIEWELWYVRLTDSGRETAAQLRGDTNG